MGSDPCGVSSVPVSFAVHAARGPPGCSGEIAIRPRIFPSAVEPFSSPMKSAEIAWAKRNGYERLETQNEERNEPIRRLNQRHGYVVEPGSVTVRGPIR